MNFVRSFVLFPIPMPTDKPLQQLLATVDSLDPETLVILENELMRTLTEKEHADAERVQHQAHLERVRESIKRHDQSVIDELRKKLKSIA